MTKKYSKKSRFMKHKGGGYRTLKTGNKYTTCKDPECDKTECSVTQAELDKLYPPFDGDNEIYIWVNDRCNKDPKSLFQDVGKDNQVKIKSTTLGSIWGHCAFSFSPNNGPIWGYGPDITPLLEEYVIKTNNGDVVDQDNYITFESYNRFIEFKEYFESISYTGTGLTLDGILTDDTESFKDIVSLPKCNVYRYVLFTKKKTSSLDENGISLGGQNGIYGIYKTNDVCYGKYDNKNIFNCITYILHLFNPYYYKLNRINGKCVFNKISMDILGKYCASIGILIETLKNTTGMETYNSNTPKEVLPACLGGLINDM